MNWTVRDGVESDFALLVACDPRLQEAWGEPFVRRVLEGGALVLLLEGEEALGYGTLEYSFFEHGYINHLFVRPAARRRGVARALMAQLETRCLTPKLFSSTNLSNAPMNALFPRLGYRYSGTVDHLDENDPEVEVFYFKALSR